MITGVPHQPALEITPSSLREALDAWAFAEQARRGLKLGQGALSLSRMKAGLLQNLPADSRIHLATVTEEHFRNSFLTMDHGPTGDTLAICAERTLAAPVHSLSRDWQKAVDHVDTFAFEDLDRSCFLFAHDLSGPFTILDGTHRFFAGYAAMVLRHRIPFASFKAFVALSKSPTCLHWPDMPTKAPEDKLLNLRTILERYRTGT
jgi:hypothetical protein